MRDGSTGDSCVFGGVTAPYQLRVADVDVELAPAGGGCLYRRRSRLGSFEAVVPGCGLVIRPAQPVYCPERLTGLAMIRLPRPLAVPPGSEAVFHATVGYDLLVSQPGGGIVDVAGVGGPCKYALYGPPSRGVIARYLPAALVEAPPPEKPWSRMLLEVVVRNEHRSGVMVSRIVYHASSAPIYYTCTGEVYGPRLSVRVTGPRQARVTVEEPRGLPEGAVQAVETREPLSPPLPLAPPLQRPAPSYVMRYGL